MKYFNFKRHKFSTVSKILGRLKDNFLTIFEFLSFKRYDFKKFYKYINIKKINFIKIKKYFDFRTIKLSSFKKINFISSKFILLHLPASIIFFTFLYLFIPTFYNYDKSNIEKIICKNVNIECIIKGKINYRFYPTPRLKIKDILINGLVKKKHTLIEIDEASIKLSFKNLLAKEKHRFKKIELNNFETHIDVKNFKKYKNIFYKNNKFIPIVFYNGKILFYEDNNYVASITSANIKTFFEKDSTIAELKGKFLNDSIYINLNTKNIDNLSYTDLILKMSNANFLSKINFSNSAKDNKINNGNFLIKKDKNKITGIFNYNNNEITVNKSNLRNTFIDGKLEGKIIFLPYFNFDLDLNLNSINFTRLFNYFLALDEKKQKNLFKINDKINGKLNFSADKVYSKHNLVNSFESRLKFYNGNVKIEQFLINLGKLGAADIIGGINNDKKFTSLKFESNVFVDNEKKFLSKLGIYNKQNAFSNLFTSGNLDLENIRMSFYEISVNEKLNNEDINYIESEFNDFILEEGYKNLFDFSKFKVFLKSIIDDKN